MCAAGYRWRAAGRDWATINAMRFGILGATEVYATDGRRLAVGGPRLRALLVLLLLDAGRLVSADRLIHGLYGDNPPNRAANALQSQVSRLRQVLSAANGPEPLVEFHPAGYRLAVDPEDVDVHRFTRLAGAGQRALATDDRRRAADLLGEALALWRGEPLADVRDAPFAPPQAVRLDELRLAAAEDRIEAELRLGAAGTIVTELRELVTAYPLRERPRGQLMRALHADGRRAEALATFADARRRLADELGTDPSPELTALHVAVLRDDPALAPVRTARPGPPADPSGPGVLPHPGRGMSGATGAEPAGPVGSGSWGQSTGLPGQLSSFVGREEELRRVGKLLGEARLVTLHGPGGAGKTRLAIEAASRQEGEIRLVELASVTAGADVTQTVLAALHLREAVLHGPGTPRDAADRLVAALADRRLLLVLDNCEHVVADAARLTDRLLGACPKVRVLATSREPLGLTGEALCPVSGLPLPPVDASPETAREYASVRLFAQRAVDASPDFDLDTGNVAEVLRICRTLDGLPLAIELAAARLRALPVAQIAARLDDRFRLLTRGSRVAQPRHQTLRAVVQWSWDLLDEIEQRLVRRLTVFAGAADLDAVERVCGPLGADVLDVLSSLVDKSLVEAAGGRFRMLETVRAFGAERLVEAGEADRLREAHAAYFLDLARTGDERLRGAEQLEWLRRLDADRDDLHAALRRALAGADTATALRLVAALSFYWWLRGLRGEGAALASQLIERFDAGPPAGLEEEYALCLLHASLGGYGRAVPDIGVAGAILWNLHRPPRQPFMLYLSGIANGPPVDMSQSLVASESWDEVLGTDPWSRSLAALGIGMMWMLERQHDRARSQFEIALAGFRALGERWGTILSLTSVIDIAYREGDHTSTEAVDEALGLADELDSTLDMAELLRTRADGRISVGDLVGAGADYQQVVELAVPAGAPELLAAAHYGLGEIARIRGDLDRARELCEQALAECPTGWFGAEGVRLGVLGTLGRIAEATGDVATARRHYREVLVSTQGIWEQETVSTAVEGLVGPVLRDGDAERAALLLGAIAVLQAGAASATGAGPVADATRARLGGAAYERIVARGAGMSREQASALLDQR